MVDDLGDYDVAPVDGNPFGSMASSPNDYDVAPVDHNPFAGPAPLPAPAPPMTSADVTARGGIGTIGPGSFAPSDQARQLVQMGLEGAGMSRGSAQDISGNFSTEAGALPGTGQLLSGADALYHAERGEYGQAALSGVGAVPDVGPAFHGVGAMFLGPVARFADREGLGAAKTALQAGEHPYDVWSQHLWEQGPGDSWRTEIADPTHVPNWGQHGETKTIGEIYPHPELYDNYPGLAKTPVDFIGGEHLPPGAMGAYDETNDRFLMNADLPQWERPHTVTHELQHDVQMREGWPGGADPAAMDVHKPGTAGNLALNFILKQTTAAQRKAMGRDAIVNEAKRFAYETKTGEAQAENPFARLGMSMDERRAAHPATTEQIPRGNQWWTDPTTGKLSFGQDVEPRDDAWDSSVDEASRIMSGRASGGPVQLNADLRRRLALITNPRYGFADGGAPDPADPNNAAFAQIEHEAQAADASDPAPAITPEPKVAGGAWGQSAEDAYQSVASHVGSALDWAGDKFEEGVGGAAATVGIPNAPGLARDLRGMIESGELGPKGEPHGPAPREPVAPESQLSWAYKRRPPPPTGPPVTETTVYSPYGAPDASYTRTGPVGGPLPGNLAKKPVQGVLPGFNDPNYPEGRISTSIPTNKAIADVAHDNANRKIGIDLARADPDSYAKNAQLIQGYGVPLPPNATSEQAHKAFVDHATQNLLALHDAYEQAIPGVTATSKLWYDGGNGIANAWADRYNRRPENVAGAIAALSPKRDWNINVGDAQRLANVERMGNILTRGSNFPVDSDMQKWLRGYIQGMADPDDRRAARATYSDMQGKTLKDMNSTQKAWFVRAYDETHGPMLGNVPVDAQGNEVPTGYHLWNPDGSMGPLAMNKSGTAPKQLTWASMDQLRKGIEAFEAEDMKPISTNMGQMHKVRNFYNNLVAPNSQQGDVTVDTHAIAAAHLTPLGITDPEVLHGLGKGAGASGSGATGAKGLYGAIAEAYRKAAAARNILPRQMQSITWEGIRSLWNPAQKTSLKDQVKNWWQQFKQGAMTRAQVYKNIFQKGFTPPMWMTGDARQADDEGD
jgi:hypothetical protein